MKIGIIGAMEEEIKVLQEKMGNVTHFEQANRLFLHGTYGKHELIVVRSGIGKVMAAQCATILMHQYGVNMVINTGSAGGIGEGLEVGDVVIGTRTAYYDVDVTGFGYDYGQLPDMPLYFEASRYLVDQATTAAQKNNLAVKKGLIVTGDSFINHPDKIKEILAHFPDALACEMEGAAIAQACSQFNKPYLVIRAMSDTAKHDATETFDEFIIAAGKKSAEMVLTLVSQLS